MSDDLSARLRDPDHVLGHHELVEAADRLDALEAWKESACHVLGSWDEVFQAAGEPGALGESKAESTKAHIEWLRSIAGRLANYSSHTPACSTTTWRRGGGAWRKDSKAPECTCGLKALVREMRS